MEYPTKRLHTEKHVHKCLYYSVQRVTFLEKYIMEDMNRRIKEGGRRFSIPLYLSTKGRWSLRWLQVNILLTMCFKSRFECPCKNHWKILGRPEWRPLGNKLEFKGKKTGSIHCFGVDEGRWWCSMSCLGVTGKPMVVTYLGRSGNPTDELSCNMVDITWTLRGSC